MPRVKERPLTIEILHSLRISAYETPQPTPSHEEELNPIPTEEEVNDQQASQNQEFQITKYAPIWTGKRNVENSWRMI